MIERQAPTTVEKEVEALASVLCVKDGKGFAVVRSLCRRFPGSDILTRARRCALVCRRHGIGREHYLTVFLWMETPHE